MSLRPARAGQRFDARVRKNAAWPFFCSPLMQFGDLTRRGIPPSRELAVDTFAYIERRLIECAHKTQSHKVRATTRWLARWQEIVVRSM